MSHTDYKVLRWVGEHSPPEYAPLIEKRFTEALKVLNAMWEGEEKRAQVKLPYGCPHCSQDNRGRFQCSICLWAMAHPSGRYNCLYVRFLGVSAAECSAISLSSRSIYIFSSRFPAVQKTDYVKGVKLCKGHIWWATRKYWGKKYQKGDWHGAV